MIETTLIILKPDTVQRGLIGEIIHRFERAGLSIVGMKMARARKDLAEIHYAEHQGKGFYNDLIEFITEAPVVLMAVRGENVIEICRKLRGPTDPFKAQPGTICGDYAHFLYKGRNLVHASANASDAERELKIWFTDEEIIPYTRYDSLPTQGVQQ